MVRELSKDRWTSGDAYDSYVGRWSRLGGRSSQARLGGLGHLLGDRLESKPGRLWPLISLPLIQATDRAKIELLRHPPTTASTAPGPTRR